MPHDPLPRAFYMHHDVVRLSRELLGKVLVTQLDGRRTSGIITETEAYAGITDRASHAFGGRHTKRNASMYAPGGTAYVFLCYGIHHLFNVVTHEAGVPHAVLVRALAPLEGLAEMKVRRGGRAVLTTSGPGNVSQALGITHALDGADLLGDRVWIEDRSIRIPDRDVVSGPRVGVDYAGADALLPYRFHIAPDLVASLP
ncbi:MAG: DNA-3-methyladenine glycosylase [Flavobacteriales bacterium]|nr:DNA-3-methyladenine glycosylase [Flavobacteriales bacterium]